ncbi:MAG: peptidoglycan DD-metalloendopeptidase family protein [Candidatus Latescibacteria bacterium]|nr:peptidoglycan DD-metalloendopeptidase family protein [Candidatus Latescibacterota bacterium]
MLYALADILPSAPPSSFSGDHAAVLLDPGYRPDSRPEADSVDPGMPASMIGYDVGSLPELSAEASERQLVLKRNETFYDALRAFGGDHADIIALVQSCKPYRNLSKVRRGDVFHFAMGADGKVERLRFDLEDQESYITMQRRVDGSYDAFELTYPVERIPTVVCGIVNASLFESLQEAGAPAALASKLGDILGWEMDFRRDMRRGDSFRVLYEEIRRDGKFLRTGPILAVEYTSADHTHRGYRFVQPDGSIGYYDQVGRSLEKQLLRAPIEYARISSEFSSRRLHPVHGRYMPHYGVDYAAPVGTPVRAGGNGVVAEAAFEGGNGRYVKIVHSNRSYETYYLHLSRFADGVRRGARVRQGEVIGYVGATGTATGPHLDYRVRRDGTWVNPRTLELPASEPIEREHLASYQATAALYSYCLGSQPAGSGTHEMAMMMPLVPIEDGNLLVASLTQPSS